MRQVSLFAEFGNVVLTKLTQKVNTVVATQVEVVVVLVTSEVVVDVAAVQGNADAVAVDPLMLDRECSRLMLDSES